jgi:hypothetical protein
MSQHLVDWYFCNGDDVGEPYKFFFVYIFYGCLILFRLFWKFNRKYINGFMLFCRMEINRSTILPLKFSPQDRFYPRFHLSKVLSSETVTCNRCWLRHATVYNGCASDDAGSIPAYIENHFKIFNVWLITTLIISFHNSRWFLFYRH